jgi:hypothetical protein
MEEAPENSKELWHSAHANGMNASWCYQPATYTAIFNTDIITSCTENPVPK